MKKLKSRTRARDMLKVSTFIFHLNYLAHWCSERSKEHDMTCMQAWFCRELYSCIICKVQTRGGGRRKEVKRSDRGMQGSLKCATYQATNRTIPTSNAIHKCSNAATFRTKSIDKSISQKKTKSHTYKQTASFVGFEICGVPMAVQPPNEMTLTPKWPQSWPLILGTESIPRMVEWLK